MTEPRIYVASLAAYNNGKLHGVWIDDCSDLNAMNEQITAMMALCPEHGEEYAIHDSEGFGQYQIGEYESLADVAALASGIEEHGLAFAAFCSNFGSVASVADFEDAYQGEWDSLTEYAEDCIDSMGALGSLPENLRCYFDYESFGRDLQLGGDVWTTQADGGGVWIFNNY